MQHESMPLVPSRSRHGYHETRSAKTPLLRSRFVNISKAILASSIMRTVTPCVPHELRNPVKELLSFSRLPELTFGRAIVVMVVH